jgi:hypothetical protein
MGTEYLDRFDRNYKGTVNNTFVLAVRMKGATSPVQVLKYVAEAYKDSSSPVRDQILATLNERDAFALAEDVLFLESLAVEEQKTIRDERRKASARERVAETKAEAAIIVQDTKRAVWQQVGRVILLAGEVPKGFNLPAIQTSLKELGAMKDTPAENIASATATTARVKAYCDKWIVKIQKGEREAAKQLAPETSAAN